MQIDEKTLHECIPHMHNSCTVFPRSGMAERYQVKYTGLPLAGNHDCRPAISGDRKFYPDRKREVGCGKPDAGSQ